MPISTSSFGDERDNKYGEYEQTEGYADIIATDNGVQVTFHAHDELMDDLVRRFDEWVERGA